MQNRTITILRSACRVGLLDSLHILSTGLSVAPRLNPSTQSTGITHICTKGMVCADLKQVDLLPFHKSATFDIKNGEQVCLAHIQQLLYLIETNKVIF